MRIRSLVLVRAIGLGCAALTAGAAVAFAQMPASPGTPPAQQIATPAQSQGCTSYDRIPAQSSSHLANRSTLGYWDRHFLHRVAKLGFEEEEVSRIVSQSRTPSPVRDFAADLVAAHEKIRADLAVLASQKGVILPAEEKDLKPWVEKKPKTLEADYLKRVQRAHKTMIALFERAALSDDADIVAFANRYLSDLRQDYTKAEALKAQLQPS